MVKKDFFASTLSSEQFLLCWYESQIGNLNWNKQLVAMQQVFDHFYNQTPFFPVYKHASKLKQVVIFFSCLFSSALCFKYVDTCQRQML